MKNVQRALIVAAALAVTQVLAQSDKPTVHPSDPSATVPLVRYRSAFKDYRPIGDEKVGDWKAANDNVGRIGGWKVYAREAQMPETVQPARSAPGPTTAPAPAGRKPGTSEAQSAPPRH